MWMLVKMYVKSTMKSVQFHTHFNICESLCENHCENNWTFTNFFTPISQNFVKCESASEMVYSLIAFDERVTFWLQRVRSLPCACAYVALFVRRLAYNHYAVAHAYNAANTQAQGSDLAHWSQKVTLLSKAIGV